MTAGCVDGHAWVVAGGTCAGCGLPVQASGPLGEDTPTWLALPFADPSASAICSASGGLHAPAHAVGTCSTCSGRVEALTTSPGRTAWLDTTPTTRCAPGRFRLPHVRRPGAFQPLDGVEVHQPTYPPTRLGPAR